MPPKKSEATKNVEIVLRAIGLRRVALYLRKVRPRILRNQKLQGVIASGALLISAIGGYRFVQPFLVQDCRELMPVKYGFARTESRRSCEKGQVVAFKWSYKDKTIDRALAMSGDDEHWTEYYSDDVLGADPRVGIRGLVIESEEKGPVSSIGDSSWFDPRSINIQDHWLTASTYKVLGKRYAMGYNTYAAGTLLRRQETTVIVKNGIAQYFDLFVPDQIGRKSCDLNDPRCVLWFRWVYVPQGQPEPGSDAAGAEAGEWKRLGPASDVKRD